MSQTKEIFNSDVFLYTTDTFSIWREKYNLLIKQALSAGIPYSLKSNPIELFKIVIPESVPPEEAANDGEITIEDFSGGWYLSIPGTLLEKFKFDVYLVHKEVLNDNTEKLLQYPNDWYINDKGELVLNTVLIKGDIISIRVYGVKEGKQWTDFYHKHKNYVLSDLTYTINDDNTTTTIELPYIIDFDNTDVFINGILEYKDNITFNSGKLTFNKVLNSTDVIGLGVVIPERDFMKYFVLSSNRVTSETYEELKNVLDNQSLLLYDWFKENEEDLKDPNKDVPTLKESEYTSRTIEASSK